VTPSENPSQDFYTDSSVHGPFSSDNISQDINLVSPESSNLYTDDHTGLNSFMNTGNTVAPEAAAPAHGVNGPSFLRYHGTTSGSHRASTSDFDAYCLLHVQGTTESPNKASPSYSGIDAPFVLVVQDSSESHVTSPSDSSIDAPLVLVAPGTYESFEDSRSNSGIDAPSLPHVQGTTESLETSLSDPSRDAPLFEQASTQTVEAFFRPPDEHVPISSLRKSICNVCEQFLMDIPEKDASTHLEICNLKRKLEIEQEKNKVLRVKLQMKTNKLSLLRKKKSLPHTTSPVAVEVFENIIVNGCKKIQGRRYSVKLKRFAIIQSFWSNSGYEDLRKHFCLPSRRTISRKLEGITADPGILTSVIQHIKEQIESGRFGKECVMLIDEMFLASRVSWDPQTRKVTGFTEMNGKNESSHTLATAALFIFLVGLNGRRWRFPVSYHLTDHFKGDDLIPILNNVLTVTHEAGIDVRGIVFDGLSANKTYAEACGASFDVKNLMHYYFHPVAGIYVYIFLDAVHMVKLARNLLADKEEVFIPGYEKPARFSHIEALHEFQVKYKCRLANKLSPIHVQFRNKIMKEQHKYLGRQSSSY